MSQSAELAAEREEALSKVGGPPWRTPGRPARLRQRELALACRAARTRPRSCQGRDSSRVRRGRDAGYKGTCKRAPGSTRGGGSAAALSAGLMAHRGSDLNGMRGR